MKLPRSLVVARVSSRDTRRGMQGRQIPRARNRVNPHRRIARLREAGRRRRWLRLIPVLRRARIPRRRDVHQHFLRVHRPLRSDVHFLEDIRELRGAQGHVEILALRADVEYASDDTAGSEQDLAGFDVRGTRRGGIEGPRKSIGALGADCVGAMLHDDDVGLIGYGGVQPRRHAVPLLSVAQNGCRCS
jgi:hypothetical protein